VLVLTVGGKCFSTPTSGASDVTRFELKCQVTSDEENEESEQNEEKRRMRRMKENGRRMRTRGGE
jgi:hypothetical protein